MHRARLSLLCLAALCAGGCELLQPPAPQPDPAMERIADLERRLAALERILASGSLIELTVQVDDLQRQTAALSGRTDTLEYSAESTQGRQRDLYVDLDNRLQALEQRLRGQAVAPPQAAGVPGGGLPVPGGSDRENYEAAFELLKQQRYAESGEAFRRFLASFPDSQLAENAQYWLAESFYVTGRFDEALAEFQAVLRDYPRSRKLPDALLKLGYSNYELQRFDAARQALERVRSEYADSTAARLAEQRLERMADEGH